MPTNTLLSIRPDYEIATRYGSAWLTQILGAASNAGIPTIDLYKENATASNFFSALETQDPLIINIFGHGNYNIIVCQDEELLLFGGINGNDDVLAERIVFNLSCRAGRDLGTSAVNKGAVAFLGYVEDFIFAISGGNHPDGGMENPLNDQVAQGFFESHNASPISYINGADLGNSFWNSQDAFNYWIKVWENIDSHIAATLMWDRDCQVIKPFPVERRVGLFPVLLAFAPLMITLLKKRGIKKW